MCIIIFDYYISETSHTYCFYLLYITSDNNEGTTEIEVQNENTEDAAPIFNFSSTNMVDQLDHQFQEEIKSPPLREVNTTHNASM